MEAREYEDKIMNRILLIQLRKLGDVITTTPLVRQLKRAFPNVEIDFLTENSGYNVYKYNYNISELIAINRKMSFVGFLSLILKIRRKKYDLVLDLFSNPESAQICFLSGIKKRYGFKKGIRDILYTNLIDWRAMIDNKYNYVVYHKFFLAENFVKVDYSDTETEFYISDIEKSFARHFCEKHGISKDRTIALCVVSERENARIPYGLYIKISNYLIYKGYNIYLVYGPYEEEQANSVYIGIENKSKVIYGTKITTVLESRAILESCKMYLGNDGGSKHISIASKIPTFTLFYKDSPENWTPVNDENHIGIRLQEYEKHEDVLLERIYCFIKNI